MAPGAHTASPPRPPLPLRAAWLYKDLEHAVSMHQSGHLAAGEDDLRSDDGSYVSAISGISRYAPSHVADAERKPKLRITDSGRPLKGILNKSREASKLHELPDDLPEHMLIHVGVGKGGACVQGACTQHHAHDAQPCTCAQRDCHSSNQGAGAGG